MSEENEIEHDIRRIKPFSGYHAFLSVVMSFVGLLVGCLMAFPIFGQFVPKSVCLPEDFQDEINSTDVLKYHSQNKNLSTHTLNCEVMNSIKRNDSVCSRFVFDNSVMNETIVTLHGLNCEKQSLNSLLTSVIFIGYSLGSLVGGVLSDRIGRILTIKILVSAFLILSATFIFTTNLVVYGIIRTLQVAAFIGSFGPSITYIFEIFGPEHRSKVTTLITGAPTSVGYSLVALFAQLTRDWWWTMMCLIIITLLFPVLLHFFVPGTIRKILDFVNLNFFLI